MSLNSDVTGATWLQRVKRFGYGTSSRLQLSGCALRAVTACTRTLSIGREKAVCGRRRIKEEPIPGTCLECATSRASALALYFARRSSATLQSNAESAFHRQHCHSALVTRVAERSPHGRQSRRARQTRWRADFQREADDPHDVFRIILTHDRSPFHVQPAHAAIVVDDAEVDR
jgi:hypothetical protein